METSALQTISSAKIEGEELIITSGKQLFRFKIAEVSERLLQATETERNDFQISPSGYGIHWPQIDEDLSLNGLLKSLK